MTFLLTCKMPGCGKTTEGTTGLCASHNKALRQIVKPKLAKVSKKLEMKLGAYAERRRAFLFGKMCVVFPQLKATTIHHSEGRIGDKLLDEKTWVPCSMKGHVWIEMHPNEARAKGWTKSRLMRS